MSQEQTDPTVQLGRYFWYAAWLVALVLLTLWFGNEEEQRLNPNQSPSSIHHGSSVEVRLQGNRYGHYLVTGEINGRPAPLLVDTGATSVAIPEHLASKLGLEKGARVYVNTANGRAPAYLTTIDRLRVGDIELRNVEALISPGINDDVGLLGMSFLRHLEMTQRGRELILRQNL